MPTNPATMTSRRLLSLLSLLQATREWPGTITPPMLFDDEQIVAIAIALRTAVASGADIGVPATRALATLRQVLPTRLGPRVDAVELTAVEPTDDDAAPASTEVLLAISAAIRAREELRFDYRRVGEVDADDARPPLRVQPHHLVSRSGRWYLVAWEPRRGDWRIYRADRIAPRIPTGPRFTLRDLPGGDVAAFLSARFKGSDHTDEWPCRGEVIVHLPAADISPFTPGGLVEALGPAHCRVRLGAWSWPGLAATLARFDADIEVIGPPELRKAFARLSARAARAAAPGQRSR